MSNNQGNKSKCIFCGLRRRGSNHDDGQQHIKLTAERSKGTLAKSKKS